MVEFYSGWAVAVHAWMVGLTIHIVLHFVVLPTASRMWDYAFG